MKILIVTGDGDYSLRDFCAKYNGRKVADLLQELDFENGEQIDYETMTYEVKEFDIPLNADFEAFVRFIKVEICNYDILSAQCFFLESETIVY